MKTEQFGMKYTARALVIALSVLICAAACSAESSLAAPDDSFRQLPANIVTIEEAPVPLAASFTVLSPDAPGKDTSGGGGAKVDYSNASEGYVMVKFSGGGKIKVMITKSGSKTYTYNLRSDGVYEVFPLTSGNGNYTVGVYENVSGNQYATAMSTSFSVKLRNSMLPFLYPSQYVNFNAKSATVAKGAELADGAADQLAVVSKIYNYVISNISYDDGKAAKVSKGQLSGYLPVVDTILASRKGICFDYAALMTAMLRSQGIPTRLEVGYVSGGIYHAWISVYISGIGWVNNLIYFDGKSWKMMDPTFASSGGQSASVAKFIGNGKNYSTQYIY